MTSPVFMNGDKLHTDDSVSHTLGVKISTLRKWRREGGGPPWVRLGKRLIGYLESDIQAWLAGQRYNSTADELNSKSRR